MVIIFIIVALIFLLAKDSITFEGCVGCVVWVIAIILIVGFIGAIIGSFPPYHG